MPAIAFDLIIVAVLIISAFQGAKKGMIFTLFGLLALLVALVGANLMATALAPKVANAIAPQFAEAIERDLGENLAQSIPDPETILGEENKLPGILGSIQDTEQYEKLVTGFVEAVQSGLEQASDTLGGVLARAVAQSLAHAVIYLLSFVIILVIWFASAHVLDFVCGLPILHGLNMWGGFLLGLFRGALIVLAAVWLFGAFLGRIPEETVEQSLLLKYAVDPGLLGSVLGI